MFDVTHRCRPRQRFGCCRSCRDERAVTKGTNVQGACDGCGVRKDNVDGDMTWLNQFRGSWVTSNF